MSAKHLFFLLLCIVLTGCDPSGSMMADFRVHRSQYEAVVRAAKSQPVAKRTTQEATLSGFPVFIERDGAGRYTITITTKPLGHVGDYGYTYADAILVTKPDPNYPSEKTLGTASNLLFVDQQIDPHWWSVYNNLN